MTINRKLKCGTLKLTNGGFIVSALINGDPTTYVASHLLLAHGAMERPMAIPGWHKPRVMTAGAG